ncbi:aminotransferase class IV [Paraflavitalea sp. CAU 1676]|uniref:aminotransferase class IV n=1 Tax=Paraflavitalea sp. CAU 1676 TaxID=3032598 RepID=UPI0023DB9E62|nr:aminotransferase class IV [Paraflavitalea sp. CAU 1676]MDF2192217.1 aminotransferase class IV [Paraflavitalea sp. CAU 1676]
MNSYIYYNDKILPAGTPLVSADNRGLRYGDGLFETMRVVKGQIVLETYHFERLFAGLQLLRFQLPVLFTPAHLEAAVLELCRKMKIETAARIRLNIVRGSGGLYDPENHQPNLIIEAWPLDPPRQLNENGLHIDIYDQVHKPVDILANIKSNNYLPYALAAVHAKENRLNDCLLLNTHSRICDATIANVFWVKNGDLFTPPLSEGGIAGVMRRHLIESMAHGPTGVKEDVLTLQTLAQADEVFLTNAIQGIKWVGRYRDSSYTNKVATTVFNSFVQPLWS